MKVLLFSPIIVGRMCMPTRIVMYRDPHSDQYVVHKEYLESRNPDPRGDSCKFIHHSFEAGGYHPYKSASRPYATISEHEARYNAEQEFKERTRKLLEVTF